LYWCSKRSWKSEFALQNSYPENSFRAFWDPYKSITLPFLTNRLYDLKKTAEVCFLHICSRTEKSGLSALEFSVYFTGNENQKWSRKEPNSASHLNHLVMLSKRWEALRQMRILRKSQKSLPRITCVDPTNYENNLAHKFCYFFFFKMKQATNENSRIDRCWGSIDSLHKNLRYRQPDKLIYGKIHFYLKDAKVMDFLKRYRKEIRSRLPRQTVSREKLEKILEAGRLALQQKPWTLTFYCITDAAKRKVLSKRMFAKFIVESPIVIVACGDKEVSPDW